MGGEVTILDRYDSETKDELSIVTNDSDLSSSSFVVERLPFSQKHWSDSPKGYSESPQIRSLISNFSKMDLNVGNDFLSEDYKESFRKYKSGEDCLNGVSPKHPKDVSTLMPRSKESVVVSGSSLYFKQHNESSYNEITGKQ